MASNQFRESIAEPYTTSDTPETEQVAPTAEKTSRRAGRSRKKAQQSVAKFERLRLVHSKDTQRAAGVSVAESYVALFEFLNADPFLNWNKPDRIVTDPENDHMKLAIIEGEDDGPDHRFLIDGNGGEEFRAVWKITRDKTAVADADRSVLVFVIREKIGQPDMDDVTKAFRDAFAADKAMPGLVVRDNTGRVLLQPFRIGPDDYAATVEPVAIAAGDLIAANATATVADREAVTA